ncbi:MAG: DUF4269 domain-containing protein [Bacteroidales bacterium]|nr:DUF4269 domain-containing protein [Bacteroidales bacterium]
MNIDFENIEYLKFGNAKQQLAYEVLTKYEVLSKLKQFDPILVGTIPININIENSDLDIICYCKDALEFKKIINDNFSSCKNFKIWEQNVLEHNAIVANFNLDNFEIEIFGQDIPTKQQNAYRHMVIEHKILIERGEIFRQKIIELKQQGYKTEPAFGVLLGLNENPYKELLNYKTN